MGCDGGTIPKRDELVRQKKKPEAKDKDAANMAKWRYCALKHDVLKRPIVVDSYGLLYNKDAILEYLLDRAQFEHGPSYIKKLKDVKELQLTENPAFKNNNNELGTEYSDVYSSPFICPLTGVEMNGKYKFCALWTCGCVLSDRALRSVNNSTSSNEKQACPKCGQEYSTSDDVIILNPENGDLDLMEQRRQRLNANQKKNGSSKRKTAENEDNTNGKKAKIESTETNHASSTVTHTIGEASSSTAATHKKVVSTNKVTTSKAITTEKGSSIQQDPTKSDLYKSLFTSSEAAKQKEKNKAHWITYNPLYF